MLRIKLYLEMFETGFISLTFLSRQNRPDRTAAVSEKNNLPSFLLTFPPDFTVGQPEHQRRKLHERRRRKALAEVLRVPTGS